MAAPSAPRVEGADPLTLVAQLRQAHSEALDALRRAEDEFFFGQLAHGDAMRILGEAHRRAADLAIALAEAQRAAAARAAGAVGA